MFLWLEQEKSQMRETENKDLFDWIITTLTPRMTTDNSFNTKKQSFGRSMFIYSFISIVRAGWGKTAGAIS